MPQDEILTFLADPDSYGNGVGTVERIDTHAAHVFLAGDRAYKMKRAVRFPFLDYSTLEKRQENCERELELNRRTAPDLYLAVVPVLRNADGSLALGDPAGPTHRQAGDPVEWLVVMRRFEQDALLDRMATAGRLEESHVLAMADAIRTLHESAERFPSSALAGGAVGGLRIAARDTLGGLRDHPEVIPPDRARALITTAGDALDRLAPLLARRCDAGFVRRCHGDLHLRNICLVEGRLRLFDCIEFNDALACIDTLYDLAFLLMDLLHRGRPNFANIVFNRYLVAAPDDDLQFEGLAALPFFLGLRAGIRAWVDAQSAAELPDKRAGPLRAEAHRYLAEAERFLDPPAPRLVAIGGYSGSGKSTLARAIAHQIGAAPGALLLRSDVIRKRLWAVVETDPLPAAAYERAVSERVYATMRRRAATALAAGHSAILDAVHDRIEARRAVEAIARNLGARFDGIWLDAPRERLTERVGSRAGDASDADAGIVEKQVASGAGEVEWRRIDASGSPAVVAQTARQQLGLE